MSATSDLAERVADYMEETAAYEEGWTMRKVIVEAARLALDGARSDGEWRAAMHSHITEMEAWACGRKSWTNMVEDQSAVAVMDAQEVVKHGEAARTYAILLHGFEARDA